MSLTDALTDDVTTPMQPTIASATNKAAAVFAVRRFWRERLRTARRPVTRKACAGSHPSTAPKGRTRAGASMMTPTTSSPAPTPSGQPTPMPLSAGQGVGPAAVSEVWAMASANHQHRPPSSASTMPPMARRVTGGSGFVVSFMAWIGGARAARRAGSVAPSSETAMPTAKASRMMGTVGAAEAVNGVPCAASMVTMASTMPQPSTTPMPDPTRPSSSAWMMTVAKTCPGETPMDRSSAYPRMESRTIMVKVLAMMNDPTNSASTAKMRISGWMKPSCLLYDLLSSSRWL